MRFLREVFTPRYLATLGLVVLYVAGIVLIVTRNGVGVCK